MTVAQPQAYGIPLPSYLANEVDPKWQKTHQSELLFMQCSAQQTQRLFPMSAVTSIILCNKIQTICSASAPN